jgi:hypothetical protein
MAMYDSAGKFREEFKELFPNGLGLRQIWFVVKMCKAARLYCRNNVALNNFMNAAFKGVAEFRQVPKQDAQGKVYPGLEIRMINPDGTAGVTEVVTEEEE